MPQSEFNLSPEMKVAINLHLTLMLANLEVSLGEMQALRVLVTLQCIAEASSRRPALGYICQSFELIMHPLTVIGIAFLVHAVLATAPSI